MKFSVALDEKSLSAESFLILGAGGGKKWGIVV